MSKIFWQIEGYDGTKKIFDQKVKAGCFTENKIKELLMALTAKAGLGYEEIVGAYARRKTKVSNNLLAVRRDGPYPVFLCGENPHFIASIVSEDDL